MKTLYFVGLMFLVPTGAAMADAYPSLPPGPGRDTVVQVCSQCHSPELVSSQRMDHAGWEDLVNQMQDNGASASDADFKTIVNYLATAFPATPPAAATGASSTNAHNATGTAKPAAGATGGSSAQTDDATGTVAPNMP